MEKPNFIEVETVEEANAIDLSEYYFDHFSDSRNRYIFAKRRGKSRG